MTTIKNTSGDYTLNINNGGGTMTVNGNLVVTGNTASINSTNTTISDNIITLNGGLSPGIAPTLNAGIEVDRGSSSNVQIRWNETVKSWQINNNDLTNANFGNIVYSPNGTVTLQANLVIQNTAVAPAATAGYNTVYAQVPAGGGSGLYITNTTNTAQELVTKTKAIVYALIM